MEKFILKSGKVIAKWISGINYFLEEKIDGNATNLILLLLAIFTVLFLIFSLIFGFQSVADNYIPFLISVIILGIVLIWVAIWDVRLNQEAMTVSNILKKGFMSIWQNHFLTITPGKLIDAENILPSYPKHFKRNDNRLFVMVR